MKYLSITGNYIGDDKDYAELIQKIIQGTDSFNASYTFIVLTKQH